MLPSMALCAERPAVPKVPLRPPAPSRIGALCVGVPHWVGSVRPLKPLLPEHRAGEVPLCTSAC
jgi:hypothetical protein